MMKGIFGFLATVVKAIMTIVQGDQPKRKEVESATQDLEKQDKDLQSKLDQDIKSKETKGK